jgi:hypothetical protein
VISLITMCASSFCGCVRQNAVYAFRAARAGMEAWYFLPLIISGDTTTNVRIECSIVYRLYVPTSLFLCGYYIDHAQWNISIICIPKLVMFRSLLAFFKKALRRIRKSPGMESSFNPTTVPQEKTNPKTHPPIRSSYAGPHIPADMSKIEFLLCVQKRQCPYCQEKLTAENCTKEHLIPKSYGGTNQIGNVCLVHESCNAKRGNDMTFPPFVRLIHERLTSPWWIIRT